MHEDVLSPGAATAFELLSRQDFLRSFYLAGGTGCALHIGHRRSQAFDFFYQEAFEISPLQNALRNLGRFIAEAFFRRFEAKHGRGGPASSATRRSSGSISRPTTASGKRSGRLRGT